MDGATAGGASSAGLVEAEASPSGALHTGADQEGHRDELELGVGDGSKSTRASSSLEVDDEASGDGKAPQRKRIRYVDSVAKHPGRWLALWILIPVAAAIVLVFTKAFSLADQTTYDYLIWSNLVVQQAVSVDAAQETVYAEADVKITPRTQERQSWNVYIMFKALTEDGNLLQAERLAFIKSIEDEFRLTYEGYSDFCWLDEAFLDCQGVVPTCSFPETISRSQDLYGLYTDTDPEEFCAITQTSPVPPRANVTALVDSLILPNGQVNSEYAYYLGTGFSSSNLTSEYLRSVFPMGAPLEGYDNQETQKDKQRDSFEDWIQDVVTWAESKSTDEVQILVYNQSYLNYLFGEMANKAFFWAVGSIVAVLFFVWFHTASLYLAIMTMLQIVLAFPLTYFIYYFIFRVSYFSSMHMLSIFLILGIGADDVFVFIDAFHQSRVELGKDAIIEDRLDWAWRRAAKAMLTTSCTTAAAFFITALSSIMPISTFGIWAGALIIIQYIWCILMFPCNVVIWERVFSERHWRYCLRKTAKDGSKPKPIRVVPASVQSKLDGFVRSPDMHASESETSNQVEHDGEHEMGGTLETQNVDHVILQHASDGSPSESDLSSDSAAVEKVKHAHEDEYRWIELFFRNPFNKYVFKMRYVNVLCGAALLGVCIWLATTLQPLQEEEDWFPESHPSRKSINWMSDNFFISGAANSFLKVKAVYGIAGLDRSGADRYDPEDIGEPIWDTALDLKPAVNQEALVSACLQISSNEELVSASVPGAVECWITEFKAYRQEIFGLDDFENYASEAALVSDLKAFFNYTTVDGSQPYIKYIDSESVGIENDQLLYFFFLFQTNEKVDQPYSRMWPIVQAWNATMTDVNEGMPRGVNMAYATAGNAWAWVITQDVLVQNMFEGIGLAIGISFFALVVSTLNVWIAVLATICVGSVVTCVLGSLAVAGVQLGVVETVAAVIVVGFSIDYIVHISHAYVESFHKKRYNRVQDALTDMGVSVVFGALTTISAGAFLFGPELLFFPKFGGLLMVTCAFSLLWSLTFFTSLLHVVGPDNHFGDLRPGLKKLWAKMGPSLRRLKSKCCGCFGKNDEREANEV
ncbi:Protein dispatched-like 3 [Porphyridium purpureum]|uniref:Protein dispatched-like 3 n=1 Tax=Porphyridium purpureum TaxID=35688 RepID=A0A5J4Z305_PORPP|nr:Protein dispatched-like 3 [Porphyridium purpureum]|eukprot:POR9767..scf295_1